MSARSYWVGLPVGITVHDDGRVEVEVDMSEASSSIPDEWAESEESDWSENAMLRDCSVIDAQPRRSSAAEFSLPAEELGELACGATYSCAFRTDSLLDLEAHLGAGEHE